MATKIISLEAENVKRLKAVHITPSENGLTIIGGNNKQGKTSVLDAIACALGGAKYKPTELTRKGSVIPARIRLELSNGLVVERKGKNASLTVTDPAGRKGGQTILDEIIETMALDLPKFIEASDKAKADTLLRIIGVGDQLARLEHDEKDTYNERLYVGRDADKKEKAAELMTAYNDVPAELISVADLIKEQQEILARNGENQRLRAQRDELEAENVRLSEQLEEAAAKVAELKERLAANSVKLADANKTTRDLEDESTAEIEESIANVEETNRRIRANLDKERAEDEAKQLRSKYNNLTSELETIRKAKADLLNGADLPLPGLSVEDGVLTYNGQKWDCMSGAEQLIVATSIVRKLNPECGFVLMDKLEQMDLGTLKEFSDWLEREGLQVIATRVSTGRECAVIIEDGTSTQVQAPDPEPNYDEF
jgi:predicted ATP-dependent endonuclease of OLD family